MSRFVRNGCGGAGRTRYAVELVQQVSTEVAVSLRILAGCAKRRGESPLWSLTDERQSSLPKNAQAVANLKETSILRTLIRFIRGRHRRTETPVGARDRLLALFDRGRECAARKIRKRRTRTSLATELRRRAIVSRALRSSEFKLKSGINVAPTGYPIYSVLSLSSLPRSTLKVSLYFAFDCCSLVPRAQKAKWV